MKLLFKGGKLEKVLVHVEGKPKNVRAEAEKEQCSQVFEGTTYLFPKPGSVMSVPPNVGAWLLGKCKPYLVEIPDDPGDSGLTPRVITAIVPEDVKPAKKADHPEKTPEKK